jgi:hypothetical protein
MKPLEARSLVLSVELKFGACGRECHAPHSKLITVVKPVF